MSQHYSTHSDTAHDAKLVRPRLRWKLSIRTKFLIVLSLVLVSSVGLYLYLASRISIEDKTLLIYELNETQVRTLGITIDARVQRWVDLLERLSSIHSNQERLAAFAKTDALAVGLAKLDDVSGSAPLDIARLPSYQSWLELNDDTGKGAEVANVSANDIARWIHTQAGAAIGQVQADTRRTLWIGRPFERALWMVWTPDGVHAAFALLPVEALIDGLSIAQGIEGTTGPKRNALSVQMLLDSDGKPLGKSLGKPILDAAHQLKTRLEMKRIGEDLATFYRLGMGGLTLVSRTEAAEAYAAARLLIEKTVLYALLVITLAFLAALFFSHSLTVPIRNLVEATRRVASGDFSQKVPVDTGNFRDELALLATSFNSMTRDLQASRSGLEEANRTLEQKVIDRTRDIKEAQEALVRTTRMASVGEVAGRAAHEVLNPLTSIVARLERIKTTNIPEHRRDLELLREIREGWLKEYKSSGAEGLFRALMKPSSVSPDKPLLIEDLENLGAIERDFGARAQALDDDSSLLLGESQRIAKIVHGMRHLTRVSGARADTQVHALIRRTLDSMSDLFLKSKIQATTQFLTEELVVNIDPDELVQVLTNLLRNAQQAGARDLKVSTAQSRDRVLIRVHDDGMGVRTEDQEKIFEPSFTTKSFDEGTGLGLSIARRFIRAYDGELTLEHSALGKETVFLIDLPTAQGRERDDHE